MWAAVIVGALILIGLYFYFRHQDNRPRDLTRSQHSQSVTTGQRSTNQKSNRAPTTDNRTSTRTGIPLSNADTRSGGRGQAGSPSSATRSGARGQTSERQGEVSDHEQHHSGYGSSQRQSSQKIDGHGRGGGHGQENEQDVSSHTDTAGGRNRHVTTYRTTTYDRRETRTRTTSSPNHSAINLSPRSRQSLQELELPPLEHPQVRTHYSNVSEKESDGRFTRVEVDDDHMEQSEVYTN